MKTWHSQYSRNKTGHERHIITYQNQSRITHAMSVT